MEINITELAALLRGPQNTVPTPGECSGPWNIGKNYLVRTVTMINVGRLVAVHPQELVLDGAAWVPDTGRFSDALKSGNFNEVEPYPGDGRVIIGRGSVVDASEIATFNRSQK